MKLKLQAVPIGLDEANAFITAHHRHHGAVVGHRFSIGAAVAEKIVGVVIVGRPVARMRVAKPQDVTLCHQIGQSVMLDNGAFSAWRVGRPTDWPGFYLWCDQWLDHPATWAVIPDVITGTDDDQDALIDEWPHGERGAPVWHMHESIDRLVRLTEEWPRVCVGSSGEYAELLTPKWERRMDLAWNAIAVRHRRLPWVHMLRGMQLVRHRWPFASVDSTDIARNHNRPQNGARKMADRWDAKQCPATWQAAPTQTCLIEMLEAAP